MRSASPSARRTVVVKKESRKFDFKDVEGLQVFMTSQGLLLPAKRSG